VAAHMDYEAEYSYVMSALDDIDTPLSQYTDLFGMDRSAVEELSTKLQVLTIVENSVSLCGDCGENFAHNLLKISHFCQY